MPDFTGAPTAGEMSPEALNAAAADAEARQADALRAAGMNTADPAYVAWRGRMDSLMDEQFRRLRAQQQTQPTDLTDARANNLSTGDYAYVNSAYDGTPGLYRVVSSDDTEVDPGLVRVTFEDALGRQWDTDFDSSDTVQVAPRGSIRGIEDSGSEDTGGGDTTTVDGDDPVVPGPVRVGEKSTMARAVKGEFYNVGTDERPMIVKVAKVAPGDDPDIVMVTTVDSLGRRETIEFGRNATFTKVAHIADDQNLPRPAGRFVASPHERGTATSRPRLYTYQRRQIVALGLDDDPSQPVPVRLAAARLRDRKPLTAADSAALSAAIGKISEQDDISEVKRRTLNRLMDRLDAAEAEAAGRPAPELRNRKVTTVTPDGIAVEDQIAFTSATGAVRTGNVTSVRSMMGGRMHVITFTNDAGEHRVHHPHLDHRHVRPARPAPGDHGPPGR